MKCTVYSVLVWIMTHEDMVHKKITASHIIVVDTDISLTMVVGILVPRGSTYASKSSAKKRKVFIICKIAHK